MPRFVRFGVLFVCFVNTPEFCEHLKKVLSASGINHKIEIVSPYENLIANPRRLGTSSHENFRTFGDTQVGPGLGARDTGPCSRTHPSAPRRGRASVPTVHHPAPPAGGSRDAELRSRPGSLLWPHASCSRPRLRDARPRPGPWSWRGAPGRETAGRRR